MSIKTFCLDSRLRIISMPIILLCSLSYSALIFADNDLAAANEMFNNPLASANLFIVENDTVTLDGDAVNSERRTNLTVIEPLIPFQIGESDWSVVHRPIIPIVADGDVPVAAGTGGGSFSGPPNFENTSGLADITYFAAFTPKPKGKFVWGAGPVFRIPTASDDALGAGKWSAGPMAVAAYSGKKYSIGALTQNLFSFAGPSNRKDVAVSTLQYFAFYNFTPEWGIGTAPIISYNWKAGADEALSLPVGLGVTRSFKIADKIPARVLVEGQYYAVQPDSFGPQWNLRFAFAMFLPSFK
jgi:hypothetical protein